ncbi:hypothetical protein [Dongia sp.]|uniref:DUF3885 domain-containing protein n=1 Tax=Dongia sp. TaxID=1977262 RepID=UPI0035B1D4E1
MAAMFGCEWTEVYGDHKPAGWMLRQAGSLPWVRFHSLPESKRYPANGEEEEIILSRAETLGDVILGEGAACWQVECRLKELIRPRTTLPATGVISSTFADDEDRDLIWNVYVSQVIWRRETLTPILLAIAHDRVGPTLWMSRETGKIFAPYDGGFDLFPASSDEVIQLKSHFAGWLSSHPEGL